jgi:hypothetical protein
MKIRRKAMLKFYSNVNYRTKIRRAKRKMKKKFKNDQNGRRKKKIKNDQNGKRKE